jgi:SAM-dependent methyltransferase
MAVRMAEKVGPAGHVYATEIDPDELVEIRRRAADAGLTNVTVVTASDTDTGLAPGCCDAIYMTDVYHHFTEPIATDKSMLAALKPGGRLFIADFYPTWLFSFWTTDSMRRIRRPRRRRAAAREPAHRRRVQAGPRPSGLPHQLGGHELFGGDGKASGHIERRDASLRTRRLR